jgi:hypothetical protein
MYEKMDRLFLFCVSSSDVQAPKKRKKPQTENLGESPLQINYT